METGVESDIPTEDAQPVRRRILTEVGLVYLGTLLAIKAVVLAQRQAGWPADVLIAVPLLFIYVPIVVLRRQGQDPADSGMVVDELWPAVKLNLKLYATIFPPFILLNHLYQGLVFHRSPSWVLPHDFLVDVLLYHLLYVALAEEFFYRGYMQTRLQAIFPPTHTILGVKVGKALLLTAALFTAGHSIVEFRWWHFSIFVPALAFGWIRARSETVIPGTIFHASCNILMVVLDTVYGVIPP